MSQSSSITDTTATTDTIGVIVGKIENALDGESAGAVIIAMLSLVVLLQKPDVTPVQLQTLIRDTSRFICLSLDGVEANPSGEPLPTSMLN